ncbi:ATP-binding protein [Vibrio mangrovi]|uniref:histidine kinase n=1 Tax=Vibrio mangrovi TaxID=474394 RepID=A0A1Y6IY53_9VIBR|nr:ATP-binding protein [Vibrio mangrovi]MDW6005212.1 ATP-binding protein [Vibrio mangrovi]SMS02578.1 Sensor protein ZraS [Vibrio mangrovi]
MSEQDSDTESLRQEIERLNKVVTSLMDRAEREANKLTGNYGLFQDAVMLENQVRRRTAELESALRENERINRDLTREREEQRKLIKKLEDAHNQLLQSEKLASIGQLAAGVAHEINNPIGFVNSNLDMLEEYVGQLLQLLDKYSGCETELSPESQAPIATHKQKIDIDYLRQDIVTLVHESIDGVARVRRIVQDLRDFSRPSDSEWQSADIHACIDSTLNVVWNEIKFKAEVVREYGEIPHIECLPSQLNQVFLNLLVNAAQAIAEWGTITIRTAMDNDQVVISISDDGVGIDEKVIAQIFDPFFTTKPIGKGTGLGLSVTYGIIEKHGGRIEVDSTLGKGTTFTIHLPIKRS